MKRIHYFQHVVFEGLGLIANWINQHGDSISATRFFVPRFTIPSTAEYDALIVMGRPMGVHDKAQYPLACSRTRTHFYPPLRHTRKPNYSIAKSAAMAKPRPSTLSSAIFSVIMPTKLPSLSNNPPPDEPGDMAALV